MLGGDTGDALDLDDHAAGHDEVRDELANDDPVVPDVEHAAGFKRHSRFRQLVGKSPVVDGLQEPGPKGAMHGHCGTDDLLRDVRVVHPE